MQYNLRIYDLVSMMKKFSFKYFMAQALGIVVVAAIAGVIISIVSEIEDLVYGTVAFGACSLVVILPLYFSFIGGIVSKAVARKTEKKAEEQGFGNCPTFYSGGSILMVDVEGGRIAYVASQNPGELQIISAKEVTNIRADYIKGVLGGTRYVFMEFFCKGKKIRIPTFTSRQTYSMNSEEVQTAISKADTYCGYIDQARAAGQ